MIFRLVIGNAVGIEYMKLALLLTQPNCDEDRLLSSWLRAKLSHSAANEESTTVKVRRLEAVSTLRYIIDGRIVNWAVVELCT